MYILNLFHYVSAISLSFLSPCSNLSYLSLLPFHFTYCIDVSIIYYLQFLILSILSARFYTSHFLLLFLYPRNCPSPVTFAEDIIR